MHIFTKEKEMIELLLFNESWFVVPKRHKLSVTNSYIFR